MEVVDLNLAEIVGVCNENVRQNEASIEKGMDELKMSIQEQGILQPLTVRPIEGGYEIVIGQRRFIAAKELGLETVPAIRKELSDDEAFTLSAIENIDRENLSIHDKKRLVDRGIKLYGDFKSLANALNRNERTLLNWAPFTSLPQEVLDMVKEGQLTETDAGKIARASYEHDDDEKIERAKLLVGKPKEERERILSTMKEEPDKTAPEIKEIHEQAPSPIKIEMEITGNGAEALREECARRGGVIKPDELIRNKISDFVDGLGKK